MLSSCDHKEIVCPYGETARIEVLYDWENAPEASPQGMTLYFFPQWEGGKIWRFDLAGHEGGPIELPCGRYSLVTCSNDSPGVSFSSAGSFYSMAADAPLSGSGPALLSTGMLYSATIAEIDVTPCGVSYLTPQGTVKDCSHGLVRCYPDSLATLYTVIVKDVKGLDFAREATAYISGVGNRIAIAEELTDGVPSVLLLGLDNTGGNSELTGRGCGFAPDGIGPYSLRVTVKRKDGTTIARDFPESRLEVNSLSRHNVIIMTEGIDIPGGDIPADPGGIEVGVDGWTVIETDIGTDTNSLHQKA